MDTCARCGKELGLLEKRTSSLMFNKALQYGLFSEYMDKKICLSCKYELLDSQGIKYWGFKGHREGMARISELSGKQNMNRARYSYWKIFSSLCYGFGGIFVLLGIYAYLYYQTNWIGQLGSAFQPYQNYSIPLLFGGIVLMIVCYVAPGRVIKKRIKNNNG